MVINLAFALLFLDPLVWLLRRTLHMYQLNSYQALSYSHWLRDNKSELLAPGRLLPLALMGFGGGDGYASAFLYSLLNGKSLKNALEFATASASMLVSAHSCSEAMPSVEAIEKFIADQKANGCGEIVTEI